MNKRMIAAIAIGAVVILAIGYGMGTGDAEPTPEPTPVATPEPTPEPTPKPTPTPEPVDLMAFVNWLDHVIATTGNVSDALEVFWAAPAGSNEEWEATLDLYTIWSEARVDLIGVDPDPCWAEGFALWTDVVDDEYRKWDEATDAMIANETIDYPGLNDTTAVEAMYQWTEANQNACL